MFFAELLNDLGLTAEELLSQKELVQKVLQYHVLVSDRLLEASICLHRNEACCRNVLIRAR